MVGVAAGTIAVRVKPGAARTRVGGCHQGRFGPALVVAVDAPAVSGRATDAALRAVAQALRLPPSSVRVRTGIASRDKLFSVDEPPDDLDQRVRSLRDC
jgi:uncharacterized protein YggU (UPF0235/DUF167 family)